jgi:hypothetical protein
MLSATLIRKKVVQVRKAREQRLLTATGMVQPFLDILPGLKAGDSCCP